MAKKVKDISEEARIYREKVSIFQEKLEQTEELKRLAEQEEQDLLKRAQEDIQKICDEHNIFCGAILSRQDILNIVAFAMDDKDKSITVPFRLYFKE